MEDENVAEVRGRERERHRERVRAKVQSSSVRGCPMIGKTMTGICEWRVTGKRGGVW